MSTDCELLRIYADHGDEAAFAEVVRRHVDLVYSAAMRLTGGDTPLSQDAAQEVFTLLARRARSLSQHPRLVGWLFTTTRLCARNLVRRERRRQFREQQAYAMQDTAPSPEVQWDSLRPVLDEAVCRLSAGDREAVLLRFFQNKSHREVGDALGLNEDAARKRVDRALEKLRAHFAHRGVTATAVMLASAISANSVQAAPSKILAQVAADSLANAGSAAGESLFLRLLLMNAKSKLLLALVAITLLLAPLAIYWLQPRPAGIAKTAVSPKLVAVDASTHIPVMASQVPSAGISPPSMQSVPKVVNRGNVAAANSSPLKGIRYLANIDTIEAQALAGIEQMAANGRISELAGDKNFAATPFAIYTFSAEALTGNNRPESPSLDESAALETTKIGFLMKSDGKPVAYKVVGLDNAGTIISQITDVNNRATSIMAAMAQLSALDEVRQETYEARLLTIHTNGKVLPETFLVVWLKADADNNDLIEVLPPELDYLQSSVIAWLKAKVGNNELMYVLPPQTGHIQSGELQEGKIYPTDEFLKLLSSLAQ